MDVGDAPLLGLFGEGAVLVVDVELVWVGPERGDEDVWVGVVVEVGNACAAGHSVVLVGVSVGGHGFE